MEEKEVDLRDYLEVILKRKRVIFAVFFVAVITAAIMSFIMPRTYEATATIGIGHIDELIIAKEDSKELITRGEILRKTMEEAGVDMSIPEFRKQIEVKDLAGTDFFVIRMQASGPEEAKRIAEILANHYLVSGNKLYQERKALIKQRWEEIIKTIEAARADIANVEDTIKQLLAPQGGIAPETMSKVILLQNILSGYQRHLNELHAQENNLKSTLIKAKNFRIIDPPFVPQDPIKPKKRLIVAISGVLSLMLGIFLAFFMEFWQSPKKN